MRTCTDWGEKIEPTVVECQKLARFALHAIARAGLYQILAEGKIRAPSHSSLGALREIRRIDRASPDAYIESSATGSTKRGQEGVAA
jgi:hypothetical protein